MNDITLPQLKDALDELCIKHDIALACLTLDCTSLSTRQVLIKLRNALKHLGDERYNQHLSYAISGLSTRFEAARMDSEQIDDLINAAAAIALRAVNSSLD